MELMDMITGVEKVAGDDGGDWLVELDTYGECLRFHMTDEALKKFVRLVSEQLATEDL